MRERLRHRIARLTRGRLGRWWRDRDAEMAEEMRLHLEHRTEQHAAAGLSPDEARAAALRQFGNVARVEQLSREGRAGWSLTTLARDIKFGGRLLRRAPGFALTAIVTLALGVGANVAVFSITRAVLIDDLPFPEAGRVVAITQRFERMMPQGVSTTHIDAIRRGAPDLQVLSGLVFATATVRGSADPERVNASRVLPEFFRVFGMAPAIGRWFGAADYRAEVAPVIISAGLWRRQFDARSDAIGAVLRVDGRPFTVVGVMPATFVQDRNAVPVDIWTPFTPAAIDTASIIYPVARLADGATLERAHAQVSAVMETRQREAGSFEAEHLPLGVTVEPIGASAEAAVRPGLLMLQGVAAFLLLITCANLANVFLAHAAARRREFGVRVALGAGRARVVGQLITEAGVVAVVGAGLGAVLAAAAVPVLAGFASTILPSGVPIVVDGRDVALGLTLAIAAALVFAGVPAWLASRADPVDAMRGGIQMTPGRGVRIFRGGLVAVQVLLALVVLTGAGLLVRSFARVVSQPLGFDARGLVTGEMEIPVTSASWQDDTRRFMREVERGLQQTLGSRPFVLASEMPYDQTSRSREWTLDGAPIGLPDRTNMADTRAVQVGFFDRLAIQVLSGRAFGPDDTRTSEPVAIVNEAFARRFAGAASPIGGQLSFTRTSPRIRIVGVVQDTRRQALAVAPREAVYTLFDQLPSTSLTIGVRGVPVAEAAAVMRAVVRAVNPDVAVRRIDSVSQKIADTERRRRFYLAMLGVFGAIAGTLAVVGISAVVSHAAGQRRREMSIRLALGARPWRLVRLVVAQGLVPVMVGLVAGLGVAWWAGLLLASNSAFRSQLFQITAQDPLTFTVVSILFLTVSAVACWIPARRVAATNLSDVLKAE